MSHLPCLRSRVAPFLATLLLAFVPLAAEPGSPAAFEEWTELTTAARVTSIAFGDGQFVAGTDFGTILVSSNALDWEHRLVPAVGSLNSLVYADGLWVAVGARGQIHTSSDLRAWTPQWSGTDAHLHHITHGQGTFVAVGGGWFQSARVILTSTNGAHWTIRDFSLSEPPLRNVIHAGNNFFASGNRGHFMTSADSRVWAVTTNLTRGSLTGLAYDGERLLALGSGGLFSSSDGGLFVTNKAPSTEMFQAAYGDGRFVATGDDNRVWLSTNGVNWISVNTGSVSALGAITYAAGRFIAGGDMGTLTVSTNGRDWHTPLRGPRAYLFTHVAAGHGRLAAVNSGQLMLSADGRSWELASELADYQFYSVGFAGGQFLAFGLVRSNPAQQILAHSSNGLDWTVSSVRLPVAPQEVVYGNQTYVGIGDHFFASPDGVNWNITARPVSTPLLGLAFGNNTFVAVRMAHSYTSINGTDWTTNSVSDFRLTDVAFGNNTFAALGLSYTEEPGVAAVSPDGIHWTTNALPAEPDSARYLNINFHGGWFIAYGPHGRILTSRDGLNWRRHILPTFAGVTSITFHNGRLVAMGNSGVVLQSAPVTNPAAPERIVLSPLLLPSPVSSGAPATLRLSLPPSSVSTLILQSSPTLVPPTWTEFLRLTNQYGNSSGDPDAKSYVDLSITNPAAYFRLTAP